MCDCEPATIYRETVYRTRKERRCVECGLALHVGDRYCSINMLFEGQWLTEAMCLDCRALHHEIRIASGCCTVIGGLLDELQETKTQVGSLDEMYAGTAEFAERRGAQELLTGYR